MKILSPKLVILFLIALSVAHTTVAENPQKAPPQQKIDSKKVDPQSIYARIGGQAAINAAVDLFYEKMLADERVNFFFEDVNMKVQIRKQKEFLSAVLGGPKPWTGKNMRDAHKNLEIREEDFAAVAENLQSTLVDLKLEQELIDEIMTLVASTKNDVMNKPEAKAE